ncbi:hypothetical protein [Nioella nitratireducens]|uniref:hypothetical protein n=1 Tax=Nioella nitratireducens TaxID=1287720 RepID=UPI000A018A79|nr:hypothetical protein [Nioella nitratireducens]
MSLALLTTICGGITVVILTMLAWAFWSDPERGLAQTTHRAEKLPSVMADRYTAFAVLALVFTLYGDVNVLIALFAVCAFMGFADGLIYARAGHPHMKHTISGVLSTVALAIAVAARVTEGAS